MFCKINKTWRVFAVVLLALATSAICNLYSTADTFAAYSVSLATSGDIELDISIDGGKGSGIVLDEVTATSTCPLGYTVSIMGPADTTLYKDGDKATNENTTNKILPTSGTKTNPLPLVGSDNGNNGSYLGTWGYTLDASATTSSNAFIGLTNTITELYTKTSASGNGQTGQGATTTDTISIYYGASADITRASGLYKLAESSTGANDNVITYIITANPACNTLAVKYNDNGANSPTTMSNQIIDLSSTTDLTLWPSNFKRSGYGFAGWNTKADGTGTSYGPNQTIPEADLQTFIDNNVTIDNGAQYINLYAMWIPSQGTIQNWQGCNTMNIGDITALTDTRDNDTYAIAKLADGKCWMIENLRLGGTSPTILTPADSNVTSNFTLSASQDPTQNAWCNAENATCYDQSMLASNNTTNTISDMTTPSLENNNGAGIYSYGNYYNWYSATAGTVTGGTSTGNASGSICPAGWHLPTGGAGGEFSALDIAMGGSGNHESSVVAQATNYWRTFPRNFIYSGYIYESLIDETSAYGEYWSAMSYYNDAYGLDFSSFDKTPAVDHLSSKAWGFAARCVASDTYTISFNPNGGSGNMASQTAFVNQATTLDANNFTAPSGKAFDGWNTAADGSGTDYADGASIINLASANNTITLYAQWTKLPVPGYVVYDGNRNTSSFGMGNQYATDTTIALWPANYARSGYGFAGWSTERLYPNATDFQTKLQSAVSAGKVYGPNQTVTTSDVSGKVLYAIWVKSAGDLQNWNGCSAMSSGQVTALTDTRDNNVYAIAKLADGKCWMIENLRLGGTNPTTLTSADSNVATNFTLPASQDPTVNAWCRDDSAACVNQSLLFSGNITNTIDNMVTPALADNDHAGIYSYGNYYNWYAATASTGTYSTVSGNATASVCPKGWHLPTGDAGGEFSALDVAIGGTGNSDTNPSESLRWRSYPNNFLYSGGVNGSPITNRGIGGRYWSPSVKYSEFNTSGATMGQVLLLNFSEFYTNPADSSALTVKVNGFPIRCLINP